MQSRTKALLMSKEKEIVGKKGCPKQLRPADKSGNGVKEGMPLERFLSCTPHPAFFFNAAKWNALIKYMCIFHKNIWPSRSLSTRFMFWRYRYNIKNLFLKPVISAWVIKVTLMSSVLLLTYSGSFRQLSAHLTSFKLPLILFKQATQNRHFLQI